MSSCSSVGRSRLPNNSLQLQGPSFFTVPDHACWDEPRAEPWTSAAPRLGASIGLAGRLLAHNLVLRENHKVAREPRPTIG